MTDQLTVFQAVVAVMNDVLMVGKTKYNTEQHFKFRSVEDIVDAVGPAMRTHGVLVLPNVQSIETERYQSRSGALMKNVTVGCHWWVFGPAGDRIPEPIVTYGEASDIADKATAKAQSVAWRTALVEIFSIPTGTPPDGTDLDRGDYIPPPRNRQNQLQGTQATPDPPELVQARTAVLKEAARIRPDLSEDDAIAWIGEQMRARNLKSDVVADLHTMAGNLQQQGIAAEAFEGVTNRRRAAEGGQS